jgi:hypothetical protein
MAQWLSAQYRDFYDLPRMIVARSDLGTFLFYSRFEGAADEYGGCYELYRMPSLSANELAASWEGLELRALERLSDLPVGDFPFDVARRAFLDYDSILPRLVVGGQFAAVDA